MGAELDHGGVDDVEVVAVAASLQQGGEGGDVGGSPAAGGWREI